MKPAVFNKPYLLIEACIHLTLWVVYFSLSRNLDFYVVTLEQAPMTIPQSASASLLVLATFYWCYFVVPFCNRRYGFYWSVVAYFVALFAIAGLDSVHSIHYQEQNVSVVSEFWTFLFKHTMWSLLSLGIKRYALNLKRSELVKERNLALAQIELAALKQQISPHFMFNVLNSLYSTSYMSGDTRTSRGIEQLSSLLRYMLYEANSQKVQLQKEVDYLDNYIRLQMLRFSDDVELEFNKSEFASNTHIAPMLLIVLVENAFKHGVNTKDKSFISITLSVKNSVISFEISNPIVETKTGGQASKGQDGGLGLSNLKRRLRLMYEDKHALDICTKDNVFTARMTLT